MSKIASRTIKGRESVKTKGGEIRADQVKYLGPWQNPNGTWSHGMDAQREWTDEYACRQDFQFSKDWA